MCVCDNTRVHPQLCTLLGVTPFQKIHSVKCCVTLLYLRVDWWQRPLLKLTLSEPGCHCHTHARRRTQCALGLAVQPSLNESEAGWYDWDRRPFRTGMTKQWPQQVSLLQNMNYQWDRWWLDWLHHMLMHKKMYFTVYASKACSYNQENSHYTVYCNNIPWMS